MHRTIHCPCSWVRLSWIVILDISGWGWGVAYLPNKTNHVEMSANKDDRIAHAPNREGSDLKHDQQNNWGVVHFCNCSSCRKHGIVIDDNSRNHYDKTSCQLRTVGVSCTHLPICADPSQAPLVKLRWMDVCGDRGVRGKIFTKDADPAEYTTGVDGILTLLPRNAARQLLNARRLFKLWFAKFGWVAYSCSSSRHSKIKEIIGVRGVPHFATIDSTSITDVPRPGKLGAPIPFCWGNDPDCADRWFHTVAAHCPRLIVEVMRAATTQLGRGCEEGSLAFSRSCLLYTSDAADE